jgi:hypothetical protein
MAIRTCAFQPMTLMALGPDFVVQLVVVSPFVVGHFDHQEVPQITLLHLFG